MLAGKFVFHYFSISHTIIKFYKILKYLAVVNKLYNEIVKWCYFFKKDDVKSYDVVEQNTLLYIDDKIYYICSRQGESQGQERRIKGLC